MLAQRVFASFLCLFAAPSFAGELFPYTDYVVEVNGTVDGKPLEFYANEWWRWAYSMKQTESPVHDTDGSFCDVNQEGPVWYLGGAFGDTYIKRKCDIPAGKHLFFPIINLVVATYPDEEQTCQAAKVKATAAAQGFQFIRAFINGTKVDYPERYRVGSKECFNLLGRVPAKFQAPSMEPSATDGYWLMLKPLPSGSHTIQFSGLHIFEPYNETSMVQNVYYELNVRPE